MPLVPTRNKTFKPYWVKPPEKSGRKLPTTAHKHKHRPMCKLQMVLSFTLLNITLCVRHGAPNYLHYHPPLNTLFGIVLCWVRNNHFYHIVLREASAADTCTCSCFFRMWASCCFSLCCQQTLLWLNIFVCNWAKNTFLGYVSCSLLLVQIIHQMVK